MSALSEFFSDRRGGLSVFGVIGSGLACVLAAVVVDLGALALRARAVQGAADLAAMSAAMSLTQAAAAAEATAEANLGGDVRVVTRLGRYTADSNIPPEARFVVGPGDANAVRVTLTQDAPLYFGALLTDQPVRIVARSATAMAKRGEPMASFSLGSRLLALRGGLANQLLSALAGGSVSLTALDYEALASSQIDLLPLVDTLSASVGTEVGDYDALMARDASVATVIEAIQPQVPSGAAAALRKIARAARADIRIGELIGIEVDSEGEPRRGLDVRINALDLVLAALETGAAHRQVALDLGASIGLASVRANLAIGERPNRSPWLAVTSSNSPLIRTAQARLYVVARTSDSLAGLAQVNVPILIEVAASEARLEEIKCEGEPRVTIGVRPGVGRASLGAVDEARLGDFKTSLSPVPATLISLSGLLTLTGQAEIEAADPGFSRVAFSEADVAALRVKTLRTTGAITGVVTSLFERLEIKVNGPGKSLDVSSMVRSISALLRPIGPVLDRMIDPIMDFLGLRLGEADTRVHGVDCASSGVRPVLVS